MLQLQHISKIYQTGNQEFHALKDISIVSVKMSSSQFSDNRVQGKPPY